MGSARTIGSDAVDALSAKRNKWAGYAVERSDALLEGDLRLGEQSGNSAQQQSGINRDPRMLPREGGQMAGNIGYTLGTARLITGTNDLDLWDDATGTGVDRVPSIIIVSLDSGSSGTLTTITGAQRDGQRLMCFGIAGNTITITHTAAATADTIFCPSNGNVTWSDDQVVEFVFDITGGKWRLTTEPSAAGGAGSPLTTKGDVFTYDTGDARLPVGADGFFLKADSGQATGLVWSATSGSEVPVWTQDHDTDGYNLILDQDGDTKLMNDRDPDIGDDQVGITVTGTLKDFLFSSAGFQVIEQSGHSEGLTLSKTLTEAVINTTDDIHFSIATVAKLILDTASLQLASGVDMDINTNDIELVDRLRYSTTGSGAPVSGDDPSSWVDNTTGDLIANVKADDQHQWNTGNNPAFFGGNKIGGTADAFFRVFGIDTVLANLEIENDKATPATGEIGSLNWYSQNSAAVAFEYAAITAHNEGLTAASEESSIFLNVRDGGTMTSYIGINAGANGVIEFSKPLEMETNNIWLDETADLTKISGTATSFNLTVGANSIFTASTLALTLQGDTTLAISELFAMSATTATGAVDGTMWHDSGTGNVLLRSGTAEINLSANTAGTFLPKAGGVMSGTIDMNGVNKILLSVDGLTTIGGGGTDDVILFELGAGTDDIAFGTASVNIGTKFQIFKEIVTPATTTADTLRLYAKDDGGVTKLYFKESTNEHKIDFDGAGGGSTFADDVFEVFDNGTSSKKITFQLENATGTNIINILGTTDTYTFPNNTGTMAMLNLPQSWSQLQTFEDGNLLIEETAGGDSLALRAPTLTGDSTVTFPDNTGTVAELNLAQTFSANQTFEDTRLLIGDAGASNTLLLRASGMTTDKTATFPNNTGIVAELNLTQTFSATQTLNSYKGTGAVTVTNILDDDTMATASATTLATSESIKAYADSVGGGLPHLDGGGATVIIQNTTNAGAQVVWDLDPNDATSIKKFTFVGGGTTSYTFQSAGGLISQTDTDETLSGIHTFKFGKLLIEESGSTGTVALNAAAIGADKIATFPDITGGVTVLANATITAATTNEYLFNNNQRLKSLSSGMEFHMSSNDDFKVFVENSKLDIFTIDNYTNGATNPIEVTLEHDEQDTNNRLQFINRDEATVNSDLTHIDFLQPNEDNTMKTWASIRVEPLVVDAGNEDGRFFIQVIKNDVITNVFQADGNNADNSTRISFRGQAPVAAPNYTTSNFTTDRVLNAGSDTLEAVADVLATLINDLTTYGLLD